MDYSMSLNRQYYRYTFRDTTPYMTQEIDLGTRKICKVNYSMTISLPKVWAENAKIKENDFVHLSMNKERFLIVKPVRKDENEKIQ